MGMRATALTPGYAAITCACCSTFDGSFGVCSASSSSQSKPAPAQISVFRGPIRLTHRPYCVRFSAMAFLKALTGVFMSLSPLEDSFVEQRVQRAVLGVVHLAGALVDLQGDADQLGGEDRREVRL